MSSSPSIAGNSLPIVDLGAPSVPPPVRAPRSTPPLPLTREEMQGRGWDEVDVVFVTGDAYVDHPSFAMAILGRLLESEGFRVAILSQPDWHSCDAWRHVRPAAAVLRDQRRQHGLDDQPLHGQPQSPQRRRL